MTAILHSTREQWLLARRNYVTASDAAAILGVDLRRGPLHVYADKLGLVEVEEQEPMAWGRRIQGAIIQGYREATGRATRDAPDTELHVHPSIPWLACTLDATTTPSPEHPAPVESYEIPACGGVPVEAKSYAEFSGIRFDDEELPLNAQIQNQIQQEVVGATWGSLAAFVGMTQPIRWVDTIRDDAFLRVALRKLEAFHDRVKRREPDPKWADVHPSTLDAAKALWPQPDGETVDLDGLAEKTLAALERAREDKKEAEERERMAASGLRIMLGSAQFGLLPDKTYVRAKRVERSGYTVKPSSYVTLSRWRPKVRRRG